MLDHEGRISEKNRWLHVLCAFFAVTTVMGTSYHEQGSWNYVFGNFAQFLLALVVMAGYYNLYESLIALGAYVSEHWEGVRRREIKGKIENFIFEAHPFWSTFAIAMLCALPYMISFSRDRFRRMHLNRCGSTWELLKTAINTRWYPQQSWEDAWLSEEWYWDPTILEFYLYFDTVPIAGSWNLISRLRYEKMKAPVWIRWFGLLFLTVFPLFPMWGFTMVKDAQYYISLLYFGVSFADILVDGTEKKNGGNRSYSSVLPTV